MVYLQPRAAGSYELLKVSARIASAVFWFVLTQRRGCTSRPAHWRYTPIVGLLVRVSHIFLIVLLAGSSTIKTICETVCVPGPTATQAAEIKKAHTATHHPARAVTKSQRSQRAVPNHGHHRAAVGPDVSPSVAHLSEVRADCCSQLPPRQRPHASLAASRSEVDLLPQSHAAIVALAALITEGRHRRAAEKDGSPPGQQLLVRTPLVLRI